MSEKKHLKHKDKKEANEINSEVILNNKIDLNSQEKVLEHSTEQVEENSNDKFPKKPINEKKSTMDKEEDFLFKVLIVAFFVVLLFLVYSIANEKPVYFSQLYFNEETIPSEVDVNSSFSFSFVIENHEEKAFQYSYLLSINDETSDKLTYVIPDFVEKGNKIERTLNLTLGSSDKPVKIGIIVPTPSSDEPLEIHFWVDVKG